jgi:hypothetical protein
MGQEATIDGLKEYDAWMLQLQHFKAEPGYPEAFAPRTLG